MKGIRIILLCGVVLWAAGCFKDTSVKTNYVLKPLSQTLSTDPYEALEGVKAYAFDADTTLYTVASYDDALNGVISLTSDLSSKLSAPTAVSAPYEPEGAHGWMHMSLSAPPQQVVAVATPPTLYASPH